MIIIVMISIRLDTVMPMTMTTTTMMMTMTTTTAMMIMTASMAIGNVDNYKPVMDSKLRKPYTALALHVHE